MTVKLKKWQAFSSKDANRWKREGSVQNMKRSKKGKWGSWEQRIWNIFNVNDASHRGD